MEHGIEGHEVCDSNNVQVCFRLGEEPMGHMKLLLSKGGSLIRDEVGRVRAGLVGMWRLEVSGQSQYLRPVLQLEWVIVEGREMSLFLKTILGDQKLGTSEVFVVCVSRKTSSNEVLECGCLSYAVIAEFLEPSLWIVLMCSQKQVKEVVE